MRIDGWHKQETIDPAAAQAHRGVDGTFSTWALIMAKSFSARCGSASQLSEGVVAQHGDTVTPGNWIAANSTLPPIKGPASLCGATDRA